MRNRQEVVAALERHDAGGKGFLTREEFTAAAQDIFECVPSCCSQALWSQALTHRSRRHVARGVSKQIFVMAVLSPLVAHYTRKLVDATIGRVFPALGHGFNKWVPDFIFAPALATTILSLVTPILFDRYDRGRDRYARSRAKRSAIQPPAPAGKKGQ